MKSSTEQPFHLRTVGDDYQLPRAADVSSKT
jgi:hypothetical protein